MRSLSQSSGRPAGYLTDSTWERGWSFLESKAAAPDQGGAEDLLHTVGTNLIALERLPKVLDGSWKDCSAICSLSPWVPVQLITVPRCLAHQQ